METDRVLPNLFMVYLLLGSSLSMLPLASAQDFGTGPGQVYPPSTPQNDFGGGSGPLPLEQGAQGQVDTDRDGCSDDWEESYGFNDLNPSDCSPATMSALSGASGLQQGQANVGPTPAFPNPLSPNPWQAVEQPGNAFVGTPTQLREFLLTKGIEPAMAEQISVNYPAYAVDPARYVGG